MVETLGQRMTADEVIERAYAAATGAAAWEQVLAGVAALAGARAVALFNVDGGTLEAGSLVALHGFAPADMDAYASHFAPLDVRMAASSPFPVGMACRDGEDWALAPILGSEIHQDFYRPRGIGQAMGAQLFASGSRLGVISVFRPLDAGGFTAAGVAGFGAVLPHLIRALQVRRQLARAAALGGALRAGLDRFPAPVFLLRRDGGIVEANAAAFALLHRPGCPLRAAAGVLATLDPGLDDALRRTLAAAADGPPPPVLCLSGPHGPPLGLMAAPSHEMVLAFVSDPAAAASADPALLAALFGLTAAEAQVALALAAGQAPDAIAAVRRVSTETVRVQAKAVRTKLRVSSQAAIAARLAPLGWAGR